MTVTTEVIY